MVAFAMIGTTISGVTFISVPGEVGRSGWTYLQFLLGNFAGYWVVALVLIPLITNCNSSQFILISISDLGFGRIKQAHSFFSSREPLALHFACIW